MCRVSREYTRVSLLSSSVDDIPKVDLISVSVSKLKEVYIEWCLHVYDIRSLVRSEE